MKREIKFRGKRMSFDKWIYGDLIHLSAGCGISDDKDNIFDCKRVEPSTVGQYTGLKDKHGKEIYEGDIVRFDDSHYYFYVSSYIGAVVMHNGIWCVEYDGECDTERRRLFADDFASRKTEVLGNVYDNPELTE